MTPALRHAADPRGLVLARLPGRRLQLLARARMGGRGRRGRRPRRPRGLGRRPPRARRRPHRRACCSPPPGAPTIPRRSPSSPRRSRLPPSATSRPWPRARPSPAPPRAAYGVAVAADAPTRSPSATPRACSACRSARPRRSTLQAFAANIVSAGVRLIPLGQTDGQRDHRRAAAARRRGRRRRARRARPRRSAASRSAPTSPRCCTRRSTPGSTAPERAPPRG